MHADTFSPISDDESTRRGRHTRSSGTRATGVSTGGDHARRGSTIVEDTSGDPVDLDDNGDVSAPVPTVATGLSESAPNVTDESLTLNGMVIYFFIMSSEIYR